MTTALYVLTAVICLQFTIIYCMVKFSDEARRMQLTAYQEVVLKSVGKLDACLKLIAEILQDKPTTQEAVPSSGKSSTMLRPSGAAQVASTQVAIDEAIRNDFADWDADDGSGDEGQSPDTDAIGMDPRMIYPKVGKPQLIQMGSDDTNPYNPL